MRRTLLAVLMMTLCLSMTACSGTEDLMQPALDLRAKLLDAGGCSFMADITADFGETICMFSAVCSYTTDGVTRVEITAPESIAGIVAAVSADGASVSYDGMLLDFGELAGGRAVPIAAPSILSLCWAGEYISSAGKEGENTLVTYLKGYDKDELTVLTRFSGLSGVPVSGEVIYDGNTVLNVSISEFSYLQ